MAQPYVGEIRMFAGNFAPAGWAFCDGQLMPISENEVLFQLIGTTYGGDGQSTFARPDLRGRVPMHRPAPGAPLGEMAGVESVTLTTQQMPNHTHALVAIAGTRGDTVTPAGNLLAESYNVVPYYNGSPLAPMNAGSVSPVGGSQPHENRQPYLCVSFIISLFGIYPNPT